MLYLTTSPTNLVKYHLAETRPAGIKDMMLISTDKLTIVTDCLIESVLIRENNLVPCSYLIEYTGKKSFKNFKQSSYNTVYLVVQPNAADDWNQLIKKDLKNRVRIFNVEPQRYYYLLNDLVSILDKSAIDYFWSEYCIGQFKSNPYKWYNEIEYLKSLHYSKASSNLFNKEDIDCIYQKVSDNIRPYLQNIFSSKSKEYILNMNNSELFVIFIGSINNKSFNRKALIEDYLYKLNKDFLEVYMIFKQSFMDGRIRLLEGVIIFDYLINNHKQELTTSKIKNLFKLI